MLVNVKIKPQNNKNKMSRSTFDISKVTYKSIGLDENALEEFLQDNIDILTEEEDYELMVIGKQVWNNGHKRMDLVALDSNGNIVVIEVKRDIHDMKIRSDNFESQAIRYASSLAKIQDIESLVVQVYARFLVRHEGIEEEEAFDLGISTIKGFLDHYGSIQTFNQDQRIILVSSSFDINVLSSSAWLLSKGVDITCIEVTPHAIGSEEGREYLLEVKRILPLSSEEDYYTEILTHNNKRLGGVSKEGKRSNLPSLSEMILAGVVHVGDEIYFKNKDEGTTAILLGNNDVEFNGDVMTLNQWASTVNYKKANGYYYGMVRRLGRSLSDLRDEFLQED
ncbi:hypothetical protein [Mesobacillus foraminis]|uniref:hypothetical protein n=1 Tax=Mesobacillus foraminis TaxID=279826 RepID=UPI000EF4E2A4|nr:hypothetical protein [Mesobacillus foraminis]